MAASFGKCIFNFKKPRSIFPKWLYIIAYLLALYFSVSPYSCQQLVLLVFKILASLIGIVVSYYDLNLHFPDYANMFNGIKEIMS